MTYAEELPVKARLMFNERAEICSLSDGDVKRMEKEEEEEEEEEKEEEEEEEEEEEVTREATITRKKLRTQIIVKEALCNKKSKKVF